MSWLKKKFRTKPLKASNINFSYGKHKILDNFSLTIKHNQVLSVVGQSGEGKSTFLHLISGAMTDSYKGKIKIHGFSRSLAKRDIGFVPQEVSLIPDLSIKDNLIFFGSLNNMSAKRAQTKGKELMKLMQLDVEDSRLPSELSGGQKVRLNIIVSLLHSPKVLILDEPFVGLDYHNRKILWHFLKHQKNRKKTVILTTHLLVEAEHHCDRIVLLKKGRVFASGKLEDLRNKLDAEYICELKTKYLSKSNNAEMLKYCENHNITMMDRFDNYLMLSVQTIGARNYFLKFLDKLGVDYEEIGFREPNLDELFLKVKNQ